MKPQVSCTSLLAWLDDGSLAVCMQGCPLVLFRRWEDKLRVASQLTEGGSEADQEGGHFPAGKHGIRGLALLHVSQGSRPDGMVYMLMCDSSGRVRCCQVGRF